MCKEFRQLIRHRAGPGARLGERRATAPESGIRIRVAQPSAAGLVQAAEASTGGHGEHGCQLRRLIWLSHGDVDTSLALLQRLGALYLDEIDGGRRQAALYWRCQLSPHGEVVDK